MVRRFDSRPAHRDAHGGSRARRTTRWCTGCRWSCHDVDHTGFPDGGQIPVKFSQAAEGAAPGEGTSPAISWANPPAGTQSFVLNMHDMDVVRNRTTDDQAHWVVWNIPATATGLPEGCSQGLATVGRQLSNQRHRSGVSRSWRTGDRSAASLHVRALCLGHQARCSTDRRRVRDARECRESDAGTHPRESGLWRIVQASAVDLRPYRGLQSRARHAAVDRNRRTLWAPGHPATVIATLSVLTDAVRRRLVAITACLGISWCPCWCRRLIAGNDSCPGVQVRNGLLEPEFEREPQLGRQFKAFGHCIDESKPAFVLTVVSMPSEAPLVPDISAPSETGDDTAHTSKVSSMNYVRSTSLQTRRTGQPQNWALSLLPPKTRRSTNTPPALRKAGATGRAYIDFGDKAKNEQLFDCLCSIKRR